MAGHRLVDRVVDEFIDEMVQPPGVVSPMYIAVAEADVIAVRKLLELFGVVIFAGEECNGRFFGRIQKFGHFFSQRTNGE